MNPSNKNTIDLLTMRGMTNRELIAEFELGKALGEFHHADHVRVAFAYLAELPLLEAIEKFSAALERFALSKGKPHLYHQTITWAYLLLIHERMARAGSAQSALHFASVQPSSVQSRSTPTLGRVFGTQPGTAGLEGRHP